MKKRIKDLSPLERPREKLLEYGADELSDTELLAVLIGTGIKGKSALDIANELMTKFGGIRGLCGRDFDDLKKTKGVSDAKLATIAATLEISTRIVRQVLKDHGFIK